MKKIAIFLMTVAICGGAHCAESQSIQQVAGWLDALHSKNHTIDKRRYVSRNIEPFSSIVGFKYPNTKNWCSGTLTADGIIVTAKHCIFTEDGNYKPMENIYINHNDIGDIGIKQRVAPGVNIYRNDSYEPTYDWAFVVPKTNMKSNILVSGFNNNSTGDVIVVGYGALKILSDSEIHTIRTEYAKWLKRKGLNADVNTGADLNDRHSRGSAFVSEIRAGKISGISSNTFNDTHKLKSSHCRATASNENFNQMNCQIWGGNSGGPVFLKYNDKWYLYGVEVSGISSITNNRNSFAQGAHMVPVNMFVKYYKEIVSKLKIPSKTNENTITTLLNIIKESNNERQKEIHTDSNENKTYGDANTSRKRLELAQDVLKRNEDELKSNTLTPEERHELIITNTNVRREIQELKQQISDAVNREPTSVK